MAWSRKRWLAVGAAVAAGLAVVSAAGTAAATPSPTVADVNWGRTPEVLRQRFAEAETAAEIPGLARALAVWGWSIGRGKYVPDAHNGSDAEVEQSIAGYDRNPSWPQGTFSDEWRRGGSFGLFDILSGTHAHAGIHDGWAPLVNYPVSSLFRVDVQLYIVGWIVFRLVSGPLRVLAAGDPGRTWANIRAAAIHPAGYQAQSTAAAERVAAFYAYAVDLGVDLAKLSMPSTHGFPGARAYWERLRVFQRPSDTLTGVLA